MINRCLGVVVPILARMIIFLDDIHELTHQEMKNWENGCPNLFPTRGVSNSGIAIHIKKCLKAKEELRKLKYFTMQKYNLQKKSSKRNQNPSRYYYNSIITNLKFQHNLAKISCFKNPHIKIDLLLPRGQNPLLSYYTL